MITKQFTEGRFVNWLEGISKSNFIAKTIVSIIIWIIALVPVWLYVFARWLCGPATFWQELAIIALAAVTVGWLQCISFIFAAVVTFTIMFED